MKVLVLGGAGGMGAGGAALLLQLEGVSRVVLSDINEEAVKASAEIMNDDRVEWRVIDALNKEELIENTKEFDVVFNAVGPYVKFGVPILEAVIEAGVDYVDVCDDHDAPEDMLKLSDKAKETGVTALICMGTTPGITNVQAKFAHSMLDECDSLKINWSVADIPIEESKGTPLEEMAHANPRDMITQTAWDHMVHVSTGDIPIWNKGQWDTMPALEHGEWIDFGEPMGRIESYYLGHAEPVTLTLYLDIKDFCACSGALQPELVKQLREEARGHREALHPPKEDNSPVWQAPEIWEGKGVFAGQAAIAEGLKDGKKTRVTVRFMQGVHDMLTYMYAGQAIGIHMIGSGEITEHGVFAPEAFIDPDKFFTQIAGYYTAMDPRNITWTKEDAAPIEIEIL